MKKIMMLILCLALISLACLETSSGALMTVQAAQVTTRGVTTEAATSPAMAEIVITATAAPVCARVIALDALHLRGEASVDGEILTWLKSGDVVQVLNDADPQWWRVRRGGDIGFARSIYLQKMECEVSHE